MCAFTVSVLLSSTWLFLNEKQYTHQLRLLQHALPAHSDRAVQNEYLFSGFEVCVHALCFSFLAGLSLPLKNNYVSRVFRRP